MCLFSLLRIFDILSSFLEEKVLILKVFLLEEKVLFEEDSWWERPWWKIGWSWEETLGGEFIRDLGKSL